MFVAAELQFIASRTGGSGISRSIRWAGVISYSLRYSMDMELIFEVRDAEEGGYCARALGHPIFTEAETWEELRANVLEATVLHFEDGPAHPPLLRMRTD
jgi:hypothetical protein